MSLRSLLVSQKDTIPEQVSRAISQAEEAELSGKVSAGTDLLGKGEVESRFQTSNSNSVQTSRKAIVQTLFNELRYDTNLDFALNVSAEVPQMFGSRADIRRTVDSCSVAPVATLTRGRLVEVEVILEVDPVFKLGTLISEYLAMSEEYPDMFGDVGVAALREVVPINKVLLRLLAGLIPIRARAANFSSIDVDGREYLVNNVSIAGLEIERHPLCIVGVTEHIGYWKDIRRVLFSSAKVTMLCRVARDGVHDSWTPVKLADLFREVAPTLVDQINQASRAGVSGLTAAPQSSPQQEALVHALRFYGQRLSTAGGIEIDISGIAESAAVHTLTNEGAPLPSAQRHAFSAVREEIERRAGRRVVSAEDDLSARQESRMVAGLLLLPSSTTFHAPDTSSDSEGSDAGDRLLDVEVVAIYW